MSSVASKAYLFSSIICLVVKSTFGQCPTSAFNVNSTVCADENLMIENLSDGEDFFWTFCEDNLSVPQNLIAYNEGNSAFRAAYTLHNVDYDGNLYGFTIRNNSVPYRLSYDLINNTISGVTIIGTSTGSTPRDFQIIEVGGSWYGIIANAGNVNPTLVSFGTAITNNSPTYSQISTTPNVHATNGLYFFENEGIPQAIMGTNSGNTIYLLSFGMGMASAPTVSSYTASGASGIHGIHLVEECGIWKGVFTSSGNNKLFRIVFSSGLDQSPTISEIVVSDSDFILPAKVKIATENGFYYGFVQTDTGNTFQLSFGNSIDNDPVVSDLGELHDNCYGIDITLTFQGWRLFGIDYVLSTMGLHGRSFDSNCTLPSSMEFEPTYSFSTPGTYTLKQVAMNADGTSTASEESFEVTSNTAPSASFSNTTTECISVPTAFTPSITGLTYQWDFDDDGIVDSFDENPSYQYPSAGPYTVRLEVDDGTCGNFTRQDITLYDEPPLPDFSLSGDLCGNSVLTFQNLTDDTLYEGPLVYEWDFNGEFTTDEKSPEYAFSTSGTKTITLTAGIPGCENTTQQVIELQPGPTSAFFAAPVCADEAMSFVNQSSGADSYFWDFGDGFTSTQANPSHIFSAGGNYVVSLAATAPDGCTTLYEQEVAVAPLPVADFDYDIPCSGSQGISFYDRSTVSGADIVQHRWLVDGEEVSQSQDPTLSFDEAGSYTVGLEVTSSGGCTSYLEQSIEVSGSPAPSATLDVQCQGQQSTFVDTTPGTIVSRLWTINGQNYTSAEVNHVFAEPGTFNVTLSVTSDDFCTGFYGTTVTVPAAPALDFTLSSLCANEDILLSDTSTPGDPIVSRTWRVDGMAIGNGPQAQWAGHAEGSYTLTLDVVTEAGCTFSHDVAVNLLPGPTAGFTSSRTYGVPPFQVQMTNISVGASSYEWRENGALVGTTANLTRQVTTEGNKTYELTAIGPNGCADTQTFDLISALPQMDARAEALQLTPMGSQQRVGVTVRNEGNLPLEFFEVVVSAENGFSFSERFPQYVEIGASVSVELSAALQVTQSERVCVRVVTAYDDISPDDNEACVGFSPSLIFEPPYPNPISDELSVRLILPAEQKVEVTIANAVGRLLVQEEYTLSEGLHTLRYDASALSKGMYFVTVRSGGKTVTRKVVK